ncbi:hypothetical protein [Bacillus xiapuensis]|uniref:hypothetical protein n=1 Tax=Bacillus xiapuensis TaxID=2014075 RepID=UPI000C231098|nr:hypothetical protein [Bacillus xiapuensis]
MSNSISSYRDLTKDPRFLAFSRLATEGYGESIVTDENRLSISFDEFLDKLETGKVVEANNLKNTYSTYADNWKFRVNKTTNSAQAFQILEVIQKAYDLGMVTKDNQLLRNKAINIYKQA